MNTSESLDSLESLNSQLSSKTLSKVCFLTSDSDSTLALSICNRLGAELSEMKIDYFSNGEARPVIKPSIHGKKIFLISTLSPSSRATGYTPNPAERSINDQLVALLLTIGALKRSGAKSITLIMPSFVYARQDKKDEPHAAISASHIARLLTVSGINHLICLDLHAAAIQGFFPEEVPVDNLYAIAPIIEYIRTYLFNNPKYLEVLNSRRMALIKGQEEKQTRAEENEPAHQEDQKEQEEPNPADAFIAVSPDEGAFKRTRKYAESLKIPYLCLTKTRDYSQKNYVDASKTQIFGDCEELKNRWAIIFDDMCDTFGTIQAAAKKLVEAKALGVIVVVTHGILSGPALDRLNQTPEVVEFICSDSLPQQKNKIMSRKVSTFSIAPLLAEVIRRRLCKESVSEIFYHT